MGKLNVTITLTTNDELYPVEVRFVPWHVACRCLRKKPGEDRWGQPSASRALRRS